MHASALISCRGCAAPVLPTTLSFDYPGRGIRSCEQRPHGDGDRARPDSEALGAARGRGGGRRGRSRSSSGRGARHEGGAVARAVISPCETGGLLDVVGRRAVPLVAGLEGERGGEDWVSTVAGSRTGEDEEDAHGELGEGVRVRQSRGLLCRRRSLRRSSAAVRRSRGGWTPGATYR
jgi:hypothetical protein